MKEAMDTELPKVADYYEAAYTATFDHLNSIRTTIPGIGVLPFKFHARAVSGICTNSYRR